MKRVASAFSVFERALSSARGERHGAQERFPVGPQLREGLPTLLLRPGSKPVAASISASFDLRLLTGKLGAHRLGKREEAELDRYEVRGMAGDHYDQEDEERLGQVAVEDAPRFLTAFVLSERGAVAVFRVHVILRSEQECGSQPVVVVRRVVGEEWRPSFRISDRVLCASSSIGTLISGCRWRRRHQSPAHACRCGL